MENKGQMGLGMMITVFIVAITGLVLFVTIAQTSGPLGDLVTINQSETLGANGAAIYVEEYKNVASVVLVNTTGGETVAAGNYTVTNNFLHPTTGALSVRIVVDDAEYATETVYVQGSAQKLDYIDSSGARALTDMILIFFALAIAVVVMGPVVNGMRDFN